MPTQNGLAALEQFGDKLKALQVICPPHPDGDQKKLRGCRNKRGQWWYYVSTRENPQPDDWIMYRKMTDGEIAELLVVDDKGELEAYRGPCGCHLLFHVSEHDQA